MNEYSDAAVLELRETLLNDGLDADSMGLYDYERLFGYETELDDPNAMVLNFCVKGLDKYEEYNKYNDYQVDFDAVYKRFESEQRKTRITFWSIPKRVAVIIVTIIVSLFLTTAVTASMGFNILKLFKNTLNVPNKTISSYAGKGVTRADGTRIYNSMVEMIKAENLKILYPAKLPGNYKFTDFKVTDTGGYLEVRVYSDKPYIDYTVRIGANYAIENYEYETNGIRYDIMMVKGLYQAQWSDGKDYYTIVVVDKDALSEIIKNLKRK